MKKRFFISFFSISLLFLGCSKKEESKQLEINSFVYFINNPSIDELEKYKFDLGIIDYSKDGDDSSRFKKDEIEKITKKGVYLLSYLSIGEASTFRTYFDKYWIDKNQNPTSLAPNWLGKYNKEWKESHKVRFWENGWKEGILKPYMDKIIEAGFSGIYLDIVDAYEYWGDKETYKELETFRFGDPKDIKESAKRMLNLISEISDYCKSKKGDFLIFPQNGSELLKYDSEGVYLSKIDGIGVEDLFYNETEEKKEWRVKERLMFLKFIKSKNKPVLVTDYVDDGSGFGGENKKRIEDFILKTEQEGFVPYVGNKNRELDSIVKINFELKK